MPLSTLVLITIGLYILITLLLGYLAQRSSDANLEDYFVGSRKTGTLALIGTIVATKINGMALTTAPGLVYEGGILYLQTFISLSISSFLFFYYGPKIWRVCKQQHFITQAELFAYHYQSKAIYSLTVILGIFSIFPFLIVQFVAIAKIFSTATSNVLTYEQSIVLLAISTGIYIFWGGARAVIWTDVFQGIVLLSLTLITAYLLSLWTGGIGQSIETVIHLIPEKLTFNQNNTPVFFDQLISWSLAFFLWPQIFQRAMMGRSPEVIQKAALGHLTIGWVAKIAMLIIGITATAALYGKVADSDRLVAEMYRENFPLGGVLLILGVFASGMSSIDSVLLTLASIFTRDIAEKLLPDLSETSRYTLAQTISVLTLGITTGLALSDFARGYLASWVTFGATLAALLLWPLLGLFTWKRATKEGVMSAMLLGLLSLGFVNSLEHFWGISMWVGNTTIVFIISAIGFWGISLLTQPIAQPTPPPTNPL